MDVYTVLPADLEKAKEALRRCEQEWWQAGAQRVTEAEVDRAFKNVQTRRQEYKEAEARSRPSFTLRYLRLVRLFVLTGLPRFAKLELIGMAAAIICGLSLVLCGLAFSSFGLVVGFTLITTAVGSCLTCAAVVLLWPTEDKQKAFQQLQRQWTERRQQAETLRLASAKAWADFNSLRESWALCHRLDEVQKKCQTVTALLASVKYQLIHSQWRSFRGQDFEHFIHRVFEMLGYNVQLTKVSGDQGVDLVVTGKGKSLQCKPRGMQTASATMR
jgi:hypothetical protein